MTDRTELRRLAVQQLESLARAGVTHLPRVATKSRTRLPAAPPTLPPPPAPAVVTESIAAMSKEDRAAALKVLQTEVAGCTRCKELAATRTQTVFGVGNITPRLVF